MDIAGARHCPGKYIFIRALQTGKACYNGAEICAALTGK